MKNELSAWRDRVLRSAKLRDEQRNTNDYLINKLQLFHENGSELLPFDGYLLIW